MFQLLIFRTFNHVTKTKKRDYVIMLAKKVLTEEQQLRNTLAHELCHIAVFAFHEGNHPPHGKLFKSYAERFHSVYTQPSIPSTERIQVTTYHDYDIDYKYRYICSSGCGVVLSRHSKSLDLRTHVCARCRSQLIVLNRREFQKWQQEPSKENRPDPSSLKQPSTPNPYREFVKEKFAEVRQELVERDAGRVSHGEIMTALSLRWKSMKLK